MTISPAARDVSPLRIPPGAPGILLFGGSFDPPHGAHVEFARLALRRAMPPGSWLVLVPAARSPFKRRAPGASERDRLAMLRAAFRPVSRVAIWTDEIDRAEPGAPSYWIDTIERLGGALAEGAAPVVRFLIGADQAAEFHRWKRCRDVIRLAEPVVIARRPFRSARLLRRELERAQFWFEPELDQWERRVLRTRISPISATAVRESLRHVPARCIPALPARVADYIDRRALYR